ncbi:MAG: hypothetical protein IKA17_05175 [Clostridia bacterium]|nr:hypothetical protein [Clostridia bacterium]
MNNTRKIVVLNNLKSQRIEQAIFILRDEKDYSEADAVIEAERIVDSYLENIRRPLLEKNTKKDNKNKLLLFWGSAALMVTALLFFIIR